MNSIPRWLSVTIAALLAVLIIIVGISQGLLAWSRADLTSSTRSITITAEGKVSASPDTAEVDASIVSNGTTAQATQSDMDQKAAQLVAYLQKSGVAQSDISTSSYTLDPNYDGDTEQEITGYSASETLSAKIHDLANVSSILGGITQNGANQIQSVTYTIDNSDNYREQAREQALSNAGQKAQDLANAAHVKLGKLITFTEETDDTTPPVFPEAAMASAPGSTNASSNATVPSGTQDIVEDISVTYALK